MVLASGNCRESPHNVSPGGPRLRRPLKSCRRRNTVGQNNRSGAGAVGQRATFATAAGKNADGGKLGHVAAGRHEGE
eukprot:7426271-Lingulodinium_polyedra.AAC.1